MVNGSVRAAVGSFQATVGTQLGTGRGEVLRPLPAWPGRRMVVVFPNLSISTSSIYKGSTFRLTHPGALSNLVSHGIPSRFWAILGSGDGAALRNDLTPATLRSAPVVGRILKEMRELGSDFASVSGSGSAVFGLAPDGRTAALWEEHFRRRGFWSKEVRPSRRGCSIRN